MTTSQPWMKFYPQDWRADEKLRMCSLAARGLWIEILALMHRSERYGHLLIAGNVPTDAQLAVQVGAPPHELTALLAELDSAGVFSRAASGAIYSRRMTRDEKRAKSARQNGKRGGNPSLRKQTGNMPSVKGSDKAADNGGVKAQKPEARSQKSNNTHTSVTETARAIPTDLRQVMEAASMTNPPSDIGLLAEWRQAGARLEEHILPTVREVTAQVLDRTGRAPFKLKLFDQAVRESVAAELRDLEHYREVTERYGAAGGSA